MTLMTRGLLFACLAILLSSLTGCNTPVSIHYTPVAAVQTIAEDPARAPRIYVLKFADARKPADTIGENQDLYGIKINDVRTSDDIGLIITEAITDALRKAGLRDDLHSERKQGDAIPQEELAGYDAVLSGEITTFYVKTKPGWNTVDATAQVTIRLSITRNGKQEWIGPIDGSAKQSDMAGGLAPVMSQALDSAIGNCVRATIEHLNVNGALKPNS